MLMFCGLIYIKLNFQTNVFLIIYLIFIIIYLIFIFILIFIIIYLIFIIMAKKY
jgi:hypothetical protein